MNIEDRECTDEAIVSGIRSGAAARDRALRCLFLDRRLKGFIFGFVQKQGGNAQDAEDIFQDAIIILERQVREGSYRGAGSLGGYIQGIARKLWLRRRSKNNRVQELQPGQEDGMEQSPEAQFIAEERQRVIDEVLDKIGQRCKQILTLYKLKHSMEEIAEAMGFAGKDVAKNEAYQCRKRFRNFVNSRPDYLDLLGFK